MVFHGLTDLLKKIGHKFLLSAQKHICGLFSLPLDADADGFQGDVFTAGGYRLPGEHDQAGTAGYLHVQDGQAADFILAQYGGQLLQIRLAVIEFGTADQQCPPLKKVPVKIGIGERDAVSGQQEIGLLQKRGARRYKVHLHRPLAQL
jgi:hypothetical protein